MMKWILIAPAVLVITPVCVVLAVVSRVTDRLGFKIERAARKMADWAEK